MNDNFHHKQHVVELVLDFRKITRIFLLLLNSTDFIHVFCSCLFVNFGLLFSFYIWFFLYISLLNPANMVPILPFSTMFSFEFWKCSESAVFVVFHLIVICYATYIYRRTIVTASIYSCIDWTIMEKTCNSSKCRYNVVMTMPFYLKH